MSVGARGVFVRTLGRLAAPIVEEAQAQIRRRRELDVKARSQAFMRQRIERQRRLWIVQT